MWLSMLIKPPIGFSYWRMPMPGTQKHLAGDSSNWSLKRLRPRFDGWRLQYAQSRKAPISIGTHLLGIGCAFFAFTDPLLADVPITIINDNIGALYVTVVDRSQQHPTSVLPAQRINGFASISVMVPTNSAGYMRINWSARSADGFFHRCGTGRRRLSANATLHVNATRRCPSKSVQ